jgi:hypothetical protein
VHDEQRLPRGESVLRVDSGHRWGSGLSPERDDPEPAVRLYEDVGVHKRVLCPDDGRFGQPDHAVRLQAVRRIALRLLLERDLVLRGHRLLRLADGYGRGRWFVGLRAGVPSAVDVRERDLSAAHERYVRRLPGKLRSVAPVDQTAVRSAKSP